MNDERDEGVELWPLVSGDYTSSDRPEADQHLLGPRDDLRNRTSSESRDETELERNNNDGDGASFGAPLKKSNKIHDLSSSVGASNQGKSYGFNKLYDGNYISFNTLYVPVYHIMKVRVLVRTCQTLLPDEYPEKSTFSSKKF